MSEPSLKGQEPKAHPCCHDHPPQYDSCQRRPDLLTSVIENEHTRRILIQRLEGLVTDAEDWVEEIEKKQGTETPDYNFDYNLHIETYQYVGRTCTEIAQVYGGMENIFKERAVHKTDLYKALAKLTEDEFKRTYDSLKRDSNLHLRNEILGQCLPSDTTNVSKMADDATAKSPVSFWKRIFRHSARP